MEMKSEENNAQYGAMTQDGGFAPALSIAELVNQYARMQRSISKISRLTSWGQSMALE
jgi:hypothetical protein